MWKHCALVALLERVAAGGRRIAYLDTHAGDGRYALGATGEWTEGIGRLWRGAPDGDDAVARYLAVCRRLVGEGDRPTSYPGSPAFARAVLGAEAELALWEIDAASCERLRRTVAGDARAGVACDDGLRALDAAVRDAETRADDVIVLLDPPWGRKADWITVPDALARTARASVRACLVLWYPVKSLTRPNATIARLAAAGVAGTIAELVTTPLDQQRRRLNGSGVLLVRPPDGALAALAAAAPALGARCATRPGVWSFRMQSWSARPAP